MTITDFINQRLDENTLPVGVQEAYRRILAIARDAVSDGETDDWLSWATGEATWKIGEYLLGADPASDAERLAGRLQVAVATTWAEHPDFDPAWTTALTKK